MCHKLPKIVPIMAIFCGKITKIMHEIPDFFNILSKGRGSAELLQMSSFFLNKKVFPYCHLHSLKISGHSDLERRIQMSSLGRGGDRMESDYIGRLGLQFRALRV